VLNKVKLFVKSNPVLVGATALALGNLVRDIVEGGANISTAVETFVLYVVAAIQRSKVTPV
jgi:hypothetical protein